MDSDLEYQINDRVIVDWNGCLYEAKIINVKEVEKKKRYKVHFTNWSSKHDEWKDAFFIFPRTEENLNTLKEQREYIAQHNVKPAKDKDDKIKEKPDINKKNQNEPKSGDNRKAKEDKKSQKTAENSKNADQKSIKRSKSKETISPIPNSIASSESTQNSGKKQNSGISLKDNKNLVKVGKKISVDSAKLKAKNIKAKATKKINDKQAKSVSKKAEKVLKEEVDSTPDTAGRNSPALSTASSRKSKKADKQSQGKDAEKKKLSKSSKPDKYQTTTKILPEKQPESTRRSSQRTQKENLSYKEWNDKLNKFEASSQEDETLSDVSSRKASRVKSLKRQNNSRKRETTPTPSEASSVSEVINKSNNSVKQRRANKDKISEVPQKNKNEGETSSIKPIESIPNAEHLVSTAMDQSPEISSSVQNQSLLEEMKKAQANNEFVEEIYWEGETIHYRENDNESPVSALIKNIEIYMGKHYRYQIQLQHSGKIIPVTDQRKLSKISEVRIRTKRKLNNDFGESTSQSPRSVRGGESSSNVTNKDKRRLQNKDSDADTRSEDGTLAKSNNKPRSSAHKALKFSDKSLKENSTGKVLNSISPVPSNSNSNNNNSSNLERPRSHSPALSNSNNSTNGKLKPVVRISGPVSTQNGKPELKLIANGTKRPSDDREIAIAEAKKPRRLSSPRNLPSKDVVPEKLIDRQEHDISKNLLKIRDQQKNKVTTQYSVTKAPSRDLKMLAPAVSASNDQSENSILSTPMNETREILNSLDLPLYFPIELLQYLEADDHRVYYNHQIPRIGLDKNILSVHETLKKFVTSKYDLLSEIGGQKLTFCKDFEKLFDQTMPRHLVYRLEKGRISQVFGECYHEYLVNREELKAQNQRKTLAQSIGQPTDKTIDPTINPEGPDYDPHHVPGQYAIKWSTLVSNQYLIRFIFWLCNEIEDLADDDKKNDFSDELVVFVMELCEYICENKRLVLGDGDEYYDSISPEYWRMLAL